VGGTHVTLVPDEVEAWADVIAVGEGYRTWPEIIRDFDRGLAPRSATWTRKWAPLDSGVAVLQERVLQQVDEHRNYWTPYLEITRGLPAQLHLLHSSSRVGSEDAAAAGR